MNFDKVLEFTEQLMKVGWGAVIIMAIRLLIITPIPSLDNKILFLYSISILTILIIFALLSTSLRHKFESSLMFKNVGFVILLMLGGGLRLYWTVQHPTIPVGDFLENHKIAMGLLNGVFQDSYSRPLGYPAILALAYLQKSDPIAGRLLNVLIGTFNIYLVYKIGKKAGGEGAGFLGAFIIAILPTEILMTSTLNAEIGAASFFAGSIYFLLDDISQDTLWRLLLAGVLYGIGILFRFSLIFHLIWIVVAVGYISASSWITKLRSIAIFLFMVIIVQSALLAWHSMASGRFSWSLFQSNVASYMLLSGTNWETRGQFSFEDATMYATWPENLRSQKVIEIAWHRITDQPFVFPILVVAKMSNLFADSRYGTFWAFYPLPEGDPIQINNWKNAIYILEQTGYIIVLLMGWVYTLRTKRPYHNLLTFLLAAIIFTAIPHILIEVQGRYHDALVPLLCAVAGIGGWQLTENLTYF